MRMQKEFASDDPDAVLSYVPSHVDDVKRLVQMCLLEMFLLQNVNMNDKVIIIADTQHTQRWSERKADLMLCNGVLAFFCICPATLESARLWAHNRTSSIPLNVEDLETVEFADVFGAISEDHHLTRCAQVCFTGTEEDQAELIYLNRYLFLVTQRPGKNVQHLGFVFHAVLALCSGSHRIMRHVWKEAPVQKQRAARDLQYSVTAAKIFRCQ